MTNYTKHCTVRAVIGAIALTIAAVQTGNAGQRGVFVGDQYYQPGPYYQGKARDSKMNTIFLFTLQVNSDATLRFNDHVVCRNGVYVGNSVWASQLNGCRGGSVTRIEMSIGNWGTTSFNNIRDLINAHGTGSSTMLYRNFQALKNAIRIDSFQMDDETTYDATSMIRFCKMLKDGLGVWTSLCPYTNQGFWKTVKAGLPDRVTGVWLQCYDGGAGNVPTQWRTALANTVILFPGCTLFDGPTLIESKMRGWKNQGFRGGFVWGDNREPDPRWGQALINAGF
jgi:hypothetical protein